MTAVCDALLTLAVAIEHVSCESEDHEAVMAHVVEAIRETVRELERSDVRP